MTKNQIRGALWLVAIALIVVLGFRLGALYNERQINQTTTEDKQKDIITKDTLKPFEFDPNTVTLKELIVMGLDKRAAVSIIKYRSAGKVYRIKEDLYTCYNISDSLYFVLEPYIVIGDKYRIKKHQTQIPRKRYTPQPPTKRRKSPLKPSRFMIDTVGVEYLVAIGAFTPRQAEVFIKWRDLSGVYNTDELRRCYVVSDSLATALEPYIIYPTRLSTTHEDKVVDLNHADSATLRSVRGIGEKSVSAIINYREKLGGFYSVSQLSEIKEVTEANFELIIQQISCDSCDISKIDVTFAPAEKMLRHPYFSRKAVRRLLKYRQLKGGWSTTQEMIKDNIFDSLEAASLRPYLDFGVHTTRQ